MKKSIGFLFAMLIWIAVMPAFAQDDDGKLSYGDVIQDEITNRNFEKEYHFEASAGDVVRIAIDPEDSDEFSNPGVLLLNADYEVIAEAFDSYGVSLFHEINKDGLHYILATRSGGRSGDGVGQFYLSLSRVPLMRDGQELCESTTSESANYYAVKASSDFDISYRFTAGSFRPEVSINRIGGGELASVSLLSGSGLERGSIGHGVTDGSNILLIVSVDQRSWDWSSNKTADYRIKFNSTEPAATSELQISSVSNMNVRGGPGTQFEILGNLPRSADAVAVGRNNDGSWLEVETGWVFADLVEACGDILQLPVTSE